MRHSFAAVVRTQAYGHFSFALRTKRQLRVQALVRQLSPDLGVAEVSPSGEVHKRYFTHPF